VDFGLASIESGSKLPHSKALRLPQPRSMFRPEGAISFATEVL